ncbi:MAG TPA: hypothetical protein ENL34_05825 [Chloroflexi bacterium]|nr:hypothetical protein [Chloroflexota bacterium]
MPRGDGTGPLGAGPGTGRGLGPCGRYPGTGTRVWGGRLSYGLRRLTRWWQPLGFGRRRGRSPRW